MAVGGAAVAAALAVALALALVERTMGRPFRILGKNTSPSLIAKDTN